MTSLRFRNTFVIWVAATALISARFAPASAQQNFFDGELDLANLNGADGFTMTDGDPGSELGGQVSSAGDLNGDGIDDFLIGADYATPAVGMWAGAAYVVFGTAAGFAPTFDLGTLDGTNGFALTGADPSDFAGFGLRDAGDFNGDGINDVIVGARFADPNGQSAAGETYVIYGSTDPFAAELSLGALNGTNGLVLNGIVANDNAGRAVSGAGDVNGDGIDDVVVGAYNADPGGLLGSGQSYVVFGSTAHGASFELSTLDGTNGFTVNGIDASDILGFAVHGAGDVNGDGFADVVLGAQGGDPGTTFSAGESFVVFGTDAGFAPTVDLTTLDGTNGFIFNGKATNDQSGRAVASAGDINGDGYDDVIVSARFADPSGQTNAGEAYIIYGTAAGFPASLDAAALDGTNGFTLVGDLAGDNFGVAVSAAGDVNSDGIDDLIVGAEDAGPNGNDLSGTSYVIFGNSDGFDATIDVSSLSGTDGFAIHGVELFDGAGGAVSGAGDVNGDGIDDVVVGARRANMVGTDIGGEAYVVFGAPGFRWTPLGGGDFATDENWIGGKTPAQRGGVVRIEPDFGGTVDGPASTIIADQLHLSAGAGTTTWNIPAGGTVIVNDLAHISDSGRLTGQGTFVAKQDDFAVAGVIDLGAAMSVVAENNMTLAGAITGTGTLTVGDTFTNEGLIEGSPQIDVASAARNVGTIRVADGEHVRFTGASPLQNSGTVATPAQIQLLGGTLEVAGSLTNGIGSPTNEAGQVIGHGTLIADSITNDFGTIAVSGDTNVLGTVVNHDTIINSGQSTLTFFDEVTHDGTEIRTSTGSTTVFFGDVDGPGAFTGTGTVLFEADYSPGSSPAAVSIAGDLALGVGATLEIELGGVVPGTEHDQLNVAGTAQLDGQLAVSFLGPFIPTPGETFGIITAAAIADQFDAVSGAGLLDPDTALVPVYTAGALTLVTAIAGDVNLDGTVDGLDANIVSQNFLAAGLGYQSGDANFDGVIDGLDANLISNHFLQQIPATAIPEPNAFALAFMGAVAMLLSPGRRRYSIG